MKKSNNAETGIVAEFDAEKLVDAATSVLNGVKWQEDGTAQTGGDSVKFHGIERYADNQILDDLSAAGDQLEQLAWKIGWLTDKLYKNLIANRHEVDYLFVCYYVAVTRLKNQRGMNTVKRWALTARFFSPKVAKQYMYDVLPMSHFAYAASFGNLVAQDDKGKKYPVWQMVLDWSWSAYQKSPVTRSISVRELKEKFEGLKIVKPSTSPVRDWSFTPDSGSAIEGVEMTVPSSMDDTATDLITSIVYGVLQNFTMAISTYIPALTKVRPEIGQALAGVVHNLEMIASKLEE